MSLHLVADSFSPHCVSLIPEPVPSPLLQDVVSRDAETQDDGEASMARRRGSDPAAHRHLRQPVPSFSRRLQRTVPRKPGAVQLRVQRGAAAEASEPQTDEEGDALRVTLKALDG